MAKREKGVKMHVQKLFLSAFAVLLSGCVATSTPQESLNEEPINTEQTLNQKSSTAQKIIKRAFKKSENKKRLQKAIEVARVCFDKQGKAHNCNYKIKNPYNIKVDKPPYLL